VGGGKKYNRESPSSDIKVSLSDHIPVKKEVKKPMGGEIIQAIGAILVAFVVGAMFMIVPQFEAAGAILTLFAWLMVAALFVGLLAMVMKFFRL
jgi:VIT1/CCC1 family predicted Fe2+/Mn2+ transporter